MKETQSQRVVMKEQVRDGTSHKLGRKRLRHLQQPGLVVVMRIRVAEIEETRLHRREQHLPCDRLLLCFRSEAFCRNPRQLSDRLMLKNLARLQVHARLVCPRDDLNREDRIAAQIEKIIIDTYLLETEDRGPNAPQIRLNRSSWSNKLFYAVRLRLRQSVAIDFAVWSPR